MINGETPLSPGTPNEVVSPIRKAAILVVSLEQPLASKLLAQLDRGTVEAVTLEIARLDRIDPDEQRLVLSEFFDLGLRRLWFAFEDLVKLEARDLRAVYENKDVQIWALALASAAQPVQEAVLAALPADSANLLAEALRDLGPFRLDDAETAQADVVERLRQAHDRGRLTLPEPGAREAILV